MDLNTSQLQTLAQHIRANTAPAVVAALSIRDDQSIRDWYNGASTTDVWSQARSGQDLFDATPITNFDGLSAGKRDAWRLMIERADVMPADFGRPRNRNAVIDIWPAAQATSILQACTRKATRAELVFGGASETATVTGGTNVTAMDLAVEGELTLNEVSAALNQF